MLCIRNFARRRPASPTGDPSSVRIEPGTVAADRCPIEDGFEAATEANRGLRLRLPDRLEDRHDVWRVDVRHQQVADDRVSERFDGGPPLAQMFDVGPLAGFRVDVVGSAFREGLRCGTRGRCRTPGGLLGVDRIESLSDFQI
jgi:hypothetical protein